MELNKLLAKARTVFFGPDSSDNLKTIAGIGEINRTIQSLPTRRMRAKARRAVDALTHFRGTTIRASKHNELLGRAFKTERAIRKEEKGAVIRAARRVAGGRLTGPEISSLLAVVR